MHGRILALILVVSWAADAGAQQRRERPDPALTYSVPVAGSPSEGPADALVTMVIASEFDCPFCERMRAPVEALRRTYKDDLRIVYKHFIVHPRTANDAARAACAAHKQGKYKAMTELIWDKGYKAGRKLDAQHMETLAVEAGLNMKRFRSDLYGAPCRAVVVAETASMRKVGTNGVPSTYINGRHITGARPVAHFARVIDEELAKAKKRTRGSKLRARRYYRKWVVRRGLKQTPVRKPARAGVPGGVPGGVVGGVPGGIGQPYRRPPRREPDPKVTYAVPVGKAPFRGPRDAKVTMVIACQFTGPYCERIRPTVDALIDKYKRDLKVVYKHFPVHTSRATIPAQAACAAHRQGKYFEMDELLWTSVMADKDWSAQRMRSEAEALGLDVDRFNADMSGACARVIRDDQAEMRRFAVTGTPASFINGRFLRGAQPRQSFEALIDEELAKANRRIRRRADVRRYYDRWVVRKGVKKVP